MEIQKIIQQLLKDSQPEDILDESDDKIESLTPIIKVSTGASVALEPENSFYVETAGVIPTLIVSEELYPFYLDLDNPLAKIVFHPAWCKARPQAFL